MKIRTMLGRCLLGCTTSLFFSMTSIAADEPATPEKPSETQKLKDEIERMKAEKELLELKVGTLPDGVAPKGDVMPTTLSVEGEILAYSTVDRVAAEIAKRVCAVDSLDKTCASTRKIAIFTEAELKLMAELRAFDAEVKRLEDKKDELAFPPAPATSCAAPRGEIFGAGGLTTANLVVQAFSLFRVDRNITGTKVTLDDFAVSAQVADKLLALGVDVVYFPSIYDLRDSQASASPAALKRLVDLLNLLARQIGETELNRKNLEKCEERFAPWFAQSADFLAQRKPLFALVDSLRADVTKPNDAGVSRIQAYQRAHRMSELSKDAWLLQIKPIAASGNVITAKNILFTKLRFGGGSVVSYMLFDAGGELKRSGTLGAYEGGKKISEIPLLIGLPPRTPSAQGAP